MSAKVIAIAQQKGGAGKTTLAAHLAACWAAGRKRVAVVDIDPQQSLIGWYALREKLHGADGARLFVTGIKGWRVRQEVEKLAREHDIVVIDSPPHAETEAKIAVRSAGLAVVPVQPSPMDVWASRPTLALAAAEKVPALLVLNRVPPRARLTEAMLAEIAGLGVPVAKTRIGNRVIFASSLAEGRAVGESQPGGKAAHEMAALAREVLRHVP